MEILKTPSLSSGDIFIKRKEIKEYFIQSFDLYESLFDILKNDSIFYKKPEPLRHPLIFYFGHTATFFINKLIIANVITERVNPQFESTFAVGVDEMNWDDLNDANYDWPSVNEVKEYRNTVRKIIIDIIESIDFKLPISWEDHGIWSILMGIEHERIHLETSSVLIRQLDFEDTQLIEDWKICGEVNDSYPENKLISIESADVQLGISRNHNFYGWDNEYGSEQISINDFKASQYLVSNGEFLEFIEAGGYKNSKYWDVEGKSWLEYKECDYPRFWKLKNNSYMYRTLTGEIPLPMNWPVDVNYHEAKAFCNWKSLMDGKNIKLPSEAHWKLLVDSNISADSESNINLKYASSTPVNMNGHGDFFDLVGNVWQWTETPIYPFNGFEVHPVYDDFTTPTFDGKHNLIKGGSWISTGNEATLNCRYAFRKHFYQHAGFRYIESDYEMKVNDFNYESDTQVSQYCEFHFGSTYYNVENFAKKSADICLEVTNGSKQNRALDLGCAVGRSSFELAKEFKHVDAIDFSARFIKCAYELQQNNTLNYTLVEEGDLVSYKSVSLKDLNLEDLKGEVEFHQGDACNLKAQFKDYDLVFMGNLIDRLYEPAKMLEEIHNIVHIGGYLIIASPFTWLEEYTKKENWLGGYKDSTGETLTTTRALDNVLSAHFERVQDAFEVEFVIRETKRKYQHSRSEFNIFKRVK